MKYYLGVLKTLSIDFVVALVLNHFAHLGLVVSFLFVSFVISTVYAIEAKRKEDELYTKTIHEFMQKMNIKENTNDPRNFN